jgi:hypothetical protein
MNNWRAYVLAACGVIVLAGSVQLAREAWLIGQITWLAGTTSDVSRAPDTVVDDAELGHHLFWLNTLSGFQCTIVVAVDSDEGIAERSCAVMATRTDEYGYIWVIRYVVIGAFVGLILLLRKRLAGDRPMAEGR